MIASLKGTLQALGGDGAVVDVHGIGFRVYMPTSTMSTLGAIGDEVELHTHLHLREDNVTLYGFATPEELGLFQTLIGVSGLGPKLALAMLSAMSVEKLAMAIASGAADLLSGIPGIGKKTANRIILELKEKIAAGWLTAPPTDFAEENTEVLSALVSLGYSVREATHALATLPADQKLTLEEKIKLSLQYFTTQ
ncbi:MAG: Holliday junction branch migration protein RuvA [Deltaproteobacteria bacterium]|nr:Holliday junction branch migration protein RuvA [Deltaproteobacteria bacterium]